jgi:antitoxin component YwqK of YwqJK toxin-antitoxin module
MLSTCAFLFASYQTLDKSLTGLYDEKNYYEVRKDTSLGYAIVYHNKLDTSYNMRKNFFDSTYSDTSFIFSRFFYHNDVSEEPYEVYSHGELFYKGLKKTGKDDGEYVKYQDSGRVDIKGTYKLGKKIGVWEDFYPTGVLFKKVYYDNEGNFIKQEIFNRNTGALVRTEKIESQHY